MQLWLRRLAALAAGVVITLAILVGAARLLLPLAPDYQDEIRRFVSVTTGLDLEFTRVGASWPIRGPELRFFDVKVSTHEGRRPLLDAREISVGINLWRLIVDRRLMPGSVGVKGARVTLERLADGRALLNGVPLEEVLRRPRDPSLPRLDLDLEEVDLTLLDAGRLVPRVRLAVSQLGLRLARPSIEFEAEVEGPDGLAGNLEVQGTIPAALLPGAAPGANPEQEWSIKARGKDLDFARWFLLLADMPGPLLAGRGDLRLEARLAGVRPLAVSVDLDAGDARFYGLTGNADLCRRLGIRGEWERSAAGWAGTLERLAIRRGDQPESVASGSISLTRAAAGGDKLQVAADAIVLADLWPLVRAVASPAVRDQMLPDLVVGEVRDLAIEATLGQGKPLAYELQADFQALGFRMPAEGPALTGLTGTVKGDQQGGELRLDATEGLIRLPRLFRTDIRTTRMLGTFSWTLKPTGPDLYSEDLLIATAEGESHSRLRLIFPPATTPQVDLVTRFSVSSAPLLLDYLPVRLMKPAVVNWLDRAIVAGRVPRGQLLWQGPMRGFPYGAGDGRFRLDLSVADGILDYAPDWPRLQNLAARIVIDRTSLESVENSGTIGGVPFQDAEVRVPDLAHEATLEVDLAPQLEANQLLGFLRKSPIAAVFGPTLGLVTASGDVEAAIQLELPIASPRDFRLKGALDADGASLGLRGVALGLSDLKGTIRIDGTRLSAEGLTARFLDEPVDIALRPARGDEQGLREVVDLAGRTPAEKLTAAFALPFPDRFTGNVAWQATAYLPERRAEQPVRVQVRSDLVGLASDLAPPLGKAADPADPLSLDVTFPEPGRLQVTGDVQRGVSFALGFASGPGNGWRLERGTIQTGGGRAQMPSTGGLVIGGSLASLRMEDWLPDRGGAPGGGTASAIRKVDLTVADLSWFGRRFPDVGVRAVRSDRLWTIDLTGPSAAGVITVPAGAESDAPITVDLQRLWLADAVPDGEPGSDGRGDPRNLPALRATVEDFAIGDMKFGRLAAELAQRGDGVVVEPLTLTSASFTITGDATWAIQDDDPLRQRSELRLKLTSRDIKATLTALGYRPVVSGEKAEVNLELFWPGGPGQDILGTAGGRVRVALDKGQVLGVEPGGGRLLGLFSIAALPRRLGMDFSDVVDEGLAFDRVQGEFRLDRGSAFTCNLGLEGPVTDLAIVGKVNFQDRTYDQLAVVRSHMSDVLALSSMAGGPVVGGTVMLLSQIFRKPLSSLGESYFRVSGSWSQPDVQKVQRSQVDLTPFKDCERYFAEVLRQLPPEVNTGR